MYSGSRHFWLLTSALAGSFIAMAVLAAITNPLDNLWYGLFFFGLLAVFLIAVGYLLTYVRWGKITAKSRSRILIVSSLILVALMLRSSGSLNWVEGLALALIGVGLWFYSGRRAN